MFTRGPLRAGRNLSMLGAVAIALAPTVGADPAHAEQPVLPDAPAVVIPVGHVDAGPRLLPVGDAPEQGLQVKTILAARSVSDAFPEITTMIGVRPDSRRWHPQGLAIDVMIPNAGSPEGVALGDEILAFALGNAARLGLQDVIWRGVYYTPTGPGGSGYGHFDHVHITTVGGGYPSGGEQYLRD